MSDSASNGSSSPAPYQKKAGKGVLYGVIAVVIVIVVVLAAFAGGLFKSNSENTLVVGTNVPWPPMESVNATTGNVEGIDMDIAQEIANRLDMKLEVRQLGWDDLIGAVQAGQIDCVMSSMTITAMRNESVTFSTPYLTIDQAVVMKSSSIVTNASGLAGLSVVSQEGTTGDIWANSHLLATGIVSTSNYANYTDISTAMQLVLNHQKDACVLDSPVAEMYVKNSHGGLKVAFTVPTDEHLGIAMKKDNTELINKVNQALADMKADGTLNQIILKWTS